MALIQCRECGGQVSNLATACPKCGAPIPNEQANQIRTTGITHISTPQSVQTTLQRITLKRPENKPKFKEPFTMSTGLVGGAILGLLTIGAMVIFGDIFKILFVLSDAGITSGTGIIVVALIVIGIGMAIGAALASLEAGKPPEEKAQFIEIPYLCPYCKKTVSHTHWGRVTSIGADLQSIKCNVCGNIAIVDWETVENNDKQI
jgi:DNA-directed RNA polymerase subunit RPC12/RpoP